MEANPTVTAEAARPLRHYGIVRADLDLGQQFAQLGHAFGESAVLGTPPDGATIACALRGPAAEIEAAIAALKSRGIKLVEIREDEGPYAGQLTAFGIEPTRDNRVRKILYHFAQCGPRASNLPTVNAVGDEPRLTAETPCPACARTSELRPEQEGAPLFCWSCFGPVDPAGHPLAV